MHIDALSVLCAQLTRELLAIAKFLLLQIMDVLSPPKFEGPTVGEDLVKNPSNRC